MTYPPSASQPPSHAPGNKGGERDLRLFRLAGSTLRRAAAATTTTTTTTSHRAFASRSSLYPCHCFVELARRRGRGGGGSGSSGSEVRVRLTHKPQQPPPPRPRSSSRRHRSNRCLLLRTGR
ncbi:hypothetical protein E2C01_020656 [Portunus trituberculatus]|uniref:Uncharacterized protein n=1 Tax=Portunus trituberculatus TaxID=210409 RepID=A0A5B7E249_PORTR|nr:hypothetical protein [Portunus trituberculatus]